MNQTFHQPIETKEQNQFKFITFTARGKFLVFCKQKISIITLSGGKILNQLNVPWQLRVTKMKEVNVLILFLFALTQF